jgi:SH3 domain-containing YSC84-like protein 1
MIKRDTHIVVLAASVWEFLGRILEKLCLRDVSPKKRHSSKGHLTAWHSVVMGMVVLAISGFTGRCFAAPPMALENRLSDCARVLREMLEAPDGNIPSDLLRRSRGTIIFPAVLKAGLGVGGHYGKGVILRKHPTVGGWGPPAFITLMGGSFGWQIGVQSTDLVLLVMTDIGLKSLFHDRLTLGADASVAAGPVGRDASASTDIGLTAGILSYSRAKGIFAGVSIKGSMIEPDWEANEAYYGSDLSIIDIFFKGKGTISRSGGELIRLLNRYGKGG